MSDPRFPHGGPGRDDSGHRWSGWPGAYCHYCGREDQREVALADGIPLESIIGNPPCPALEQEKEAVDRQMNPEYFK